MDHGFLNTSLKSRGDIDAQIDRFKAQQASEAKTARKAATIKTAADREQAKALFAAISNERLSELAARCNVTAAVMSNKLRSDCHWQPALIIQLLGKVA